MTKEVRKGTCSVCRAPSTYYGNTTQYCISDYQKIKEQLAIVVEALKHYQLNDLYEPIVGKQLTKETARFSYELGGIARKALKQIEEIGSDSMRSKT